MSRICAVEACGTILSQYNTSEACARHPEPAPARNKHRKWVYSTEAYVHTGITKRKGK